MSGKRRSRQDYEALIESPADRKQNRDFPVRVLVTPAPTLPSTWTTPFARGNPSASGPGDDLAP